MRSSVRCCSAPSWGWNVGIGEAQWVGAGVAIVTVVVAIEVATPFGGALAGGAGALLTAASGAPWAGARDWWYGSIAGGVVGGDGVNTWNEWMNENLKGMALSHVHPFHFGSAVRSSSVERKCPFRSVGFATLPKLQPHGKLLAGGAVLARRV